MERKSKHDMQGKVGKYKDTFEKKCSLSRVEKMIEGTRKYHLNRQMNDTNEYEDPMDLKVHIQSHLVSNINGITYLATSGNINEFSLFFVS